MFAGANDAAFLLRIEDTDVERNRPELTDNILDMLQWLGLDWDGEPIHQSDRFDEYEAAARRLIEAGGRVLVRLHPGAGADARTRSVAASRATTASAATEVSQPGPGRALRFRVPDDGVTGWDDLIRGKVTFDNEDIEDFVLVRSNGNPTFFLANVVDDAAMGITHVIRGEDHVNGTPKYLLLRAALGFGEPPTFAHLPSLGERAAQEVVEAARRRRRWRPTRNAASCPRRCATTCRCSGGDRPMESRSVRSNEIVELFRLEDVNPSPAFFDLKKLEHINGEWIRRLDTEDFVGAPSSSSPATVQRAALSALGRLAQQRVRV